VSWPDQVPDWWSFAIMALAVFRVYRLIAEDDILDRPRDWLLDKLEEERLEKLDKLITCPWCLGWWLSVALWLFWLAAPAWAVGLSLPWALSAAVGLIAKSDELLGKALK
jgi:hypothetical protein